MLDFEDFHNNRTLSEEEYDYLRDMYGKRKSYSKEQIKSANDAYKQRKIRIGKVYYDVKFKDKEVAKKQGLKWDNTTKSWYINMYDKNLTMTLKGKQSSPRAPKDMERLFKKVNDNLGITFKVSDYQTYNAK